MSARTVDGWSVAHVATGFILASLQVPRGIAYAIIVGTEIIETFLRRVPRLTGFFAETQQNIVADLLFSVLGFELTRALL